MNSTPTIQLAPTELPSVTLIGNLLSDLDEATRARVLELRYMKSPLVEGKTPFAKMIQKALMECSYFDVVLGQFIRTKITQGARKLGVMGCYSENDYVRMHIAHFKFLRSNLVYLWFTGELPKNKMQMDHIDGNKVNDCPGNLRLVTNALNAKNTKMQSNNTSGYTGVSWNRNKARWQAYVMFVRLGYFNTPEEAHTARQNYIIAHPELGFTSRHGT